MFLLEYTSIPALKNEAMVEDYNINFEIDRYAKLHPIYNHFYMLYQD